MAPPNLEQLTATTQDVAREAGELLVDYQQRLQQLKIDSKSSSVDLFSEADVEAEKLIAKYLLELLPGSGFVGEESTVEPNPDAEYQWVVDPLDGTSNYLAGLPIWCVSIGLCDNSLTPLAGVVHSPLLNMTFWAFAGGGAFLNGRQVTVRKQTVGGGMQNAMLATGFPYDACNSSEDQSLPQFIRMQSRFHKIRRMGSAAIDLSLVAAGMFDGMWELKLKSWDTAAGTIMIREAGGMCTRYDGSPYSPGDPDMVAAATPELAAEIRKALGH